MARAYRGAEPVAAAGPRPDSDGVLVAALATGQRCAEWALVDRDPKHLEDGLTAYCLEDFRLDAHENLVHLSRLWDAGKTLHADTMGIFNQVGRCASPQGLQHLSNFSARPEDAKSPWSMGLEKYQEGGHTRFRPRRAKGTEAAARDLTAPSSTRSRCTPMEPSGRRRCRPHPSPPSPSVAERRQNRLHQLNTSSGMALAIAVYPVWFGWTPSHVRLGSKAQAGSLGSTTTGSKSMTAS